MESECTIMKEELIKQIKINMVLVEGSSSNYRFSKDQQRSVLIDCGVTETAESPQSKRRSSEPAPARSQRNVLLDVSDAIFLIVSRHPSTMRCRQLIPWSRIVNIIFKDELPLVEIAPVTAKSKKSNAVGNANN